jgi:hypothetical protein
MSTDIVKRILTSILPGYFQRVIKGICFVPFPSRFTLKSHQLIEKPGPFNRLSVILKKKTEP